MKHINDKVLTDLEIMDKIFPTINNTITIWGQKQLIYMLSYLLISQNDLNNRQEKLLSIINKPSFRELANQALLNIKTYENDIIWLLDNEYNDCLYFSQKYELLNYSTALTVTNTTKTFAPFLNIIIYMMIYIFLSQYGIKISIKDYLYGMYNSYVVMSKQLISFVTYNDTVNHYGSNFMATAYVLYQIYITYTSYLNAYKHYTTCNDFIKKINNIFILIQNIKFIYLYDTIFIERKDIILTDLHVINNLFDINKITDIGYCLMLKYNLNDYITSLNNIITYISIIDAHLSCANLILHHNYSLPNFMTNTTPYINIKKCWNPLLPYETQVKNDLLFDDNKMIILTGANTSGKSTYMRNVMLSCYLSQTIGITCCKNIIFTPFTILFTYINIPDVIGRESLFEAEMNRCNEYIQLIKSLNNNEFIFTIIDELFTGTNPTEGIAGSYAVCDYLTKFSNSLLLLTTHFHEITKLQHTKEPLVLTKQFIVDINTDGTIDRNYILQNGVSIQNIAIQLLLNKGFNHEIIYLANQYIKSLK